jgi:hypothetical protein
MSENNEHPALVAAGFIGSPIGGFVAGWVFQDTVCAADVCVRGFNETAAGWTTIIGVVLTGLVLITGGNNNLILWCLAALAAGAGIAFLTA